MSAPFNALILLNPQVGTISKGEFCENGKCAMTISYEFGIDLSTSTTVRNRATLADGTRRWEASISPTGDC